MLLADVAAASSDVAAAGSRTARAERMAQLPREAALEALVPAGRRAPRLVTEQLDGARAFQAAVLERADDADTIDDVRRLHRS